MRRELKGIELKYTVGETDFAHGRRTRFRSFTMRSFSFTDFIKRALPFFAALVIGVFIASFFVDLSRPRFGRGWRGRECHKAKMLRLENEELKNENLRLRNQLESMKSHIHHPTEPAFEMDWRDEITETLPASPPKVKSTR